MSRVGFPPDEYNTNGLNIERPDSFKVSGSVKIGGDSVFSVTAGDALKDIGTGNQVILTPSLCQLEFISGNNYGGAFDTGGQFFNWGGSCSSNAGAFAWLYLLVDTFWFVSIPNQVGGRATLLGMFRNSQFNNAEISRFQVAQPFSVTGRTLSGGGAFWNDWGGGPDFTVPTDSICPTDLNTLTLFGYAVGGGDDRQALVRPTYETWNILDYCNLTDIEFAYSVRQLTRRSELCMTVYRNADTSDTKDIGWTTDGYVASSEITNFASGTDVRIKTWYDQSGNGYDATLAGGNPGPIVYDNSTSSLVTVNGILAPRYDGSESIVSNTGGSGDVAQPLTVHCVCQWNSSTGAQFVFDGDSANRVAFYQNNNVLKMFVSSDFTISGINAEAGTMNVHTCVYDYATGSPDNSAYYNDGTNYSGTGNIGSTGGLDGVSIGERFGGSGLNMNGHISEIVILKNNSDPTVTKKFAYTLNQSQINYFK